MTFTLPPSLVNCQKTHQLSLGCFKDQIHIKVLSHITNPKNQHSSTTTLRFSLAKCSVSISYICSHPTGLRPPAPAQQDRVTKSRNQQLLQVMHI